jgi:pilus assembly protein CpaD
MTNFQRAIAKRCGGTALRLLAAIGLAATLAGCYQTASYDYDAYPNDYRERHPITLKEGSRTVEIFLGRNRGGLTPSQRADVLAFAQAWRHDATGGIVIDVPRGGPTARAATDSMREVHSILTAADVPSRAVFVRGYRPPGDSLASIKLNYSSIVAKAGPCGQWPHDLGPTLDPAYTQNWQYWNLGCASQRNLAAMVDNPADLVQPRGETPAYTARRSIALNKYRKGENPSSTYLNDGGNGYQTGKISDTGK